MKSKKVIKTWISIIALLLVWIIVTNMNIVSSYILPSPGKVLDSLVKMIQSGEIFEDIYNREGANAILKIRELERDQSFIRRYLTQPLCNEMNLFEYITAGSEYMISEVSDDRGWIKIRDTLANTVGIRSIPVIKVQDWLHKEGTMLLAHEFDGRELELGYTYETLKHIVELWGGKVTIATLLDGKKKIITCDESKRISLFG